MYVCMYVDEWMAGWKYASVACLALMPCSMLHASGCERALFSFCFNEAKACSPALHGRSAAFAASELFPMPMREISFDTSTSLQRFAPPR